VLYRNLTYYDAAEMTYYGASVIHPKTIKPLANQQIPLFVRSFAHPKEPGTRIGNPVEGPAPAENGEGTTETVPAIIFKQNQSLITFNIRDFSFITERNLSQIFFLLDMLHIKINVMQNSAISVSICIDGNDVKNRALLSNLESEYEIRYNEGLTLITVKNYTEAEINALTDQKDILLEQRTRHTYQIVVK
jgi:aspartate kinase